MSQLVPKKPNRSADWWSDAAAALASQGQLDDAIRHLQEALAVDPKHANALSNLGVLLARKGKNHEAVSVLYSALEVAPNHANALANMANSLRELGRFDEALAYFERTLRVDPKHVDALNNFGATLCRIGRLDEAVESWRKAYAIAPNDRETLINLAIGLKEMGLLDEAMEKLKRVIARYPDARFAYGNLFFAMQFNPNAALADMRQLHEQYHALFELPLQVLHQPHRNRRDPDRRLKIGYVSADLRHHVMMHYIEPILERHDKANFEIYCYYTGMARDEISHRLASHVEHFVHCRTMTPEQLAESVRIHGIDILVDLSGHTGDNRLMMFAQKPAPIQITYLGYPGSSWLKSMDYLITDINMDPEGSDEWYAEQLIRLDVSHFCFRPTEEGIEVSDLPVLKNGYITFGSFSNVNKIDRASIVLWARVLNALPDSRLVMATVPEGRIRTRLIDDFADLGIAPERLSFYGRLPAIFFKQLMHSVDIALDPVAINSPSTMCDTLWMGLPTITLVGHRAPSRSGISVLQAAGLPEFAAASESEYIDIARHLSQDLPRLAEMRAQQRAKVAASALMDEVGFVRKLEAAYRQAWVTWCDTPSAIR